jgi:hypothetical protein
MIVATVVTFIGSLAVFAPINPSPLVIVAVAVGYGAFLGWLVIGLWLASNYRAQRWLWASTAAPGTVFLVIYIGLTCWPGAVLRWLPLIAGVGVGVGLSISCLGCACILAALGWWSYSRRGQAGRPAPAESDVVESHD